MRLHKLLVIGLLGLTCLTCVACGNKKEDEPVTGALSMPDYTDEITGVVGRFENDIVMLFTETNGAIVLGGDMNFEGLKTGDRLTIYCDGVMESYPCQAIVKEMVLKSKGSAENLPKEELEKLSGMGYKLEADTSGENLENRSEESTAGQEEEISSTYRCITMEEAKILFETPGNYISVGGDPFLKRAER